MPFDWNAMFSNPMLHAGMAMLGGSMNQQGPPRNIGQVGMQGLQAYGMANMMGQQMASQQSMVEMRKAEMERKRREEEQLRQQGHMMPGLVGGMLSDDADTRKMAMMGMLGANPGLAKTMLPSMMAANKSTVGTREMQNAAAQGLQPGTEAYNRYIQATTGPRDPLVQVWDEKTGRSTYVPRGQAAGQQAPPKSTTKMSFNPETGAFEFSQGGGLGQTTTPTMSSQTTIQKDIQKAQDQLAIVDRAVAKFDPKYQTVGGKFSVWLAQTQGKMGLPMTQSQLKTLEGSVDHQAAAARLTAETMHDLTGAAQTESEAARMRPFLPNLDDDPVTFERKLGEFKIHIEALGLRRQLAQEQGIGWGEIPLEDVVAEVRKKHGASMLKPWEKRQ